MKANKKYSSQSGKFWANLKLISQKLGYTDRETKQVKIFTKQEIVSLYNQLGFDSDQLFSVRKNEKVSLGELNIDYSKYRTTVLNQFVKNNLMDIFEAKKHFERLKREFKPTCPLPMNKQKGTMKTPAYFTGMINMIIENSLKAKECNFDPKALITFNINDFPVRIMSCHVDGAFPTLKNPIAMWEIKEYYSTTTFGSRVADGIYEVFLDGIEVRDAEKIIGRKIYNYLMVDAYQTWWVQGKSYLCRIIDLLHIGMVDEALFGKEIFERLPKIVKSWR